MNTRSLFPRLALICLGFLATELYAAPTINSQPFAATVFSGNPVTLSVNATTSNGTLSYQWRKGTTNLVASTFVSGVTSTALSMSNPQTADSGSYNVVVTDLNGSTTSLDAVVTITDAPPTITGQAAPILYAPIGGTVRLVVNLAGSTPLTMQWKRDGVGLDGPYYGTSVGTLDLFNLSGGQFGTYVLQVSNAYGSVVSQPILVTQRQAAPYDNWSFANPKPQGNLLSSLVIGPGRLVAVGVGGLILTSSDGGNSWQSQSAGTQQALSYVTYDAAKSQYLYGGGFTQIATSPDALTWTTRYPPGGNENYPGIATDGSRYVAVGGDFSTLPRRAIARVSTDGGVTWTQTVPGTNNALNGVAFGASKFVAVGAGGTVLNSTDGTSWSAVTFSPSAPTAAFNRIVFANGQFVAVGANAGGGMIYTSPDGLTFTRQTNANTNNLSGVTLISGSGSTAVWAAVGANATVLTSTNNGVNWSAAQVSGPATMALNDIQSDGTNVYVVGQAGRIFKGAAGSGFTAASLTELSFSVQSDYIGALNDVIWDATTNQFVAASSTGNIHSSPDGWSWTQRANISALGFVASVTRFGSQFLAAASSRIATSPDGQTWTDHGAIAGAGQFQSIAVSPTLAVAVGASGQIYTSGDGTNWAVATGGSGTSSKLIRVAYGHGHFMAVGGSDTNPAAIAILTSTDGNNWTASNPGTTGELWGVDYGNGIWMAIGSATSNGGGAFILRSNDDGATWQRDNLAPSTFAYNVRYLNGAWYFVGSLSVLGVSHDNGNNWDYIPLSARPATQTMRGVAAGNGDLVIVGNDGTVLRSANENNPPTISVQPPLSQSAALGSTATISVTAGQSVSATYQWRKNGTNISTVSNPSAASPTLVLPNVQAADLADYDVVVTNSVASTTSNLAKLLQSPAGGDAFPNFAWRNPLPAGGTLQTVIYAQGKYVAAGVGGRVMTSTDGVSWTPSANPMPIESVYGLAYDGAQFIAVGSSGKIFTAADPTAVWAQRASAPQWLYGVTFATGHYVAVGGNGLIYTSTNGTSWSASTSPTTNSLQSVAGTTGHYVAVGQNSTLLHSTDAANWTIVTPPAGYTFQQFNGVVFLNNQFVVVGSNGAVLSSPDGTAGTWTGHVTGNGDWLHTVAYDGAQYAVAADGNSVYTSPDLVTWSFHPLPVNTPLFALSYNIAGGFVAVGGGGEIWSSTDTLNWTSRGATGGAYRMIDLTTVQDGSFLAVGSNGLTAISPDGVSWVRSRLPNSNWSNGVAVGGPGAVAVSGFGDIAVTTDGVNWVNRTVGDNTSNNGVVFAQNRFLAVGDNGRVRTSSDGFNWTSFSIAGLSSSLRSVAALGSLFIAVGDQGKIYTSPDGTNWTARTSSTNQNLQRVRVLDGTVFAVGDNRTLLLSVDGGMSWLNIAQPNDYNTFGYSYHDIAHLPDGFYIASSQGQFIKSPTLSTSDGSTWTRVAQLAFGENLNAIAVSGSKVVVAADGGTLMESTLPAAGAAPAITLPPAGQTAFAGANLLLSVGATGAGPLTYQWKKDGNDVAGATAAVLVLPNAQTGATGNYTVVVSGPGGSPVTSNPAALTVSIPAPLTITSPATAGGVINTFFNYQVQASGGVGAYGFAVTGGSLPAGLNLNTGGGQISGNPSATGAFPVTITVTDQNATTATLNLAINIAAFGINSGLNVTAAKGVAFNYGIGTTGMIFPITYAITSGTLPAGLTLNPSNGSISGTPTALGSPMVTLQAIDSSNPVKTATASLTINVVPVMFTSSNNVIAIIGHTFSDQLTAAGGTTPYNFAVTSGTLPAGLSLSPGGLLSGTATGAVGQSNPTVTVTDSTAGTANTAQVGMNINVTSFGIPSPLFASGTVNTAFSFQVPAFGGTPSYTYSANGLPGGLAIDPSTGLISGTPNQAGFFYVNLNLSDSSSPTQFAQSANLNLTIAPPPFGFYGVGDLPGGAPLSEIRDATNTAGGIVAVGASSAHNGAFQEDTPVRWTPNGGLAALPGVVNNSTSLSFMPASAITPDGSVIAGRSAFGTTGNARVATIWTNNGTTPISLGYILGGSGHSAANALSTDGSVVYGFSRYDSIGNFQAFRWTSAGGLVALGFLNVGDASSVPAGRGTSADGSVMVGTSSTVTGLGLGSGNIAFRYVFGSGISALPLLSGGTWSAAIAISPNGNLALGVGDSAAAPNGEVILWNHSAATTTSLGTPNPAFGPGNFGGMTGDGQVFAIAFGPVANSESTNTSFIHNSHGWFGIESVLRGAGMNLNGWNVSDVLGMSADGTLVYGSGRHNGKQEGWVATFSSGYLASLAAAAPTIAGQPIGQAAVSGGTVNLSVNVVGAPAPAYQWRRDGSSIAGATNPTLTLTNVTPGNGGYYSVDVTNANGATSSRSVPVSVIPAGGDAFPSFAWRNPLSAGGTLQAIVYAQSKFTAVGIGGLVLSSPDGVSWTQQATLNTEVLNSIIFNGSQYVAVGGGGKVFTSTDGIAWTQQITSPQWLNGVCFAGGKFVTVGGNGLIEMSTNAVSWTTQSSPTNMWLAGVAGTSGHYVAVGGNGVIITSTDAVSWVQVTPPSGYQNQWFNGVAFFNGQFIITGNNGTVLTSQDGATWSPHNTGIFDGFNQIAYDGAQYVVTSSNGAIARSTDLTTWTRVPLAVVNPYPPQFGIAAGGGVFALVGAGGEIWTSPDGQAWTSRASAGGTYAFNDLLFDGTQFVAVGSGGLISTSTDGVVWTQRPTPAGYWLSGVAFNGDAGAYVAVSSNGNVLASPDTLTWNDIPVGDYNADNGVAVANGQFIVVGNNGLIRTSFDGFNWSKVTSTGITANLRSVAAVGPMIVAVGDNGAIYTSTNTTTWNSQASGTSQNLNRVRAIDGTFFALGSNRTLLVSGDGITWLPITMPNDYANLGYDHRDIVRLADGYYIVSSQGLLLKSPDLVNWSNAGHLALGENLFAIASGSNRVVIAGNGGTLLESALAAGGAAPAITLQPVGQTVTAGANILLTASATGTGPLTYQWQKGGTNIAGATAAVLVLPNAQTGATGSYTVVVSGPGGSSATSSSAAVTINAVAAPVITSLPIAAQTVTGNATLSVTANGTAPLSYQWYKGLPGDTSTPVSTNSSYTTPALTTSDHYWVRVSNSGGSVDSPATTAFALSPVNPTSVTNGINGFAYGNSTYVAVVYGNTILRSTDNGVTWVRQVGLTGTSLRGVAFGGGVFVAVGGDGGNSLIRTSADDGQTWSTASSGSNQLNGVVYDGSQFVAVGNNSTVLTSPTGAVWTPQSLGTTGVNLQGIAVGGSALTYVAVGQNGALYTSTNATGWASQVSGTANTLYGAAFGAGKFVVVGNSGTILKSSDATGTSWSTATSNTTTNLNTVVFGNGLFVSAGGSVFSSPDGTTWTNTSFTPTHSGANGATMNASVYANNQFVMGGFAGAIFVSPTADNGTWVLRNTAISAGINDVIHAAGRLVLVGNVGVVVVIPDGGAPEVHLPAVNGVANTLRRVAYGNGLYVVVGDGGRILTSPDTQVWTNRTLGGSNYTALAYGNGLFVAAGAGGAYATSGDGGTWTTGSGTIGSASVAALTYGAGVFVAVDNSGGIYTSANGTGWTAQSSSVGTALNHVTFAGGQFVAVGANSVVLTSPAGTNWTAENLGTPGIALNKVAYGDGLYLAVHNGPGNSQSIFFSRDGVAWNSTNPSNSINEFSATTATYGNGGFVITGAGSLTFQTLPASDTLHLDAQPASQTFASGQTIALNVSATNATGYQWYEGASGDTANAVSGANSASFTTPALTQSKFYWVRVTGPKGVIDSATATLLGPPTIVAPPHSLAAGAGSSVSFNVGAIGSGAVTYQWQKDGNNLVDGGNVSGSTGPTLTLADAQAPDAGAYTVIVNNANGGPVTSGAAALTVTPQAPSFATTLGGSPRLVAEGSTFQLFNGYAVVSINNVATSLPAVRGTEPITYQWQKNGANLSDGGTVSGANTPSLAFTNVLLSDAGDYTLFVSNSVGNATSGVFTLGVAGGARPYVFTTLAGQSNKGGNDGNGTAARFANPQNMVLASGILYIADSANQVIRVLDTSTGQVATLAGLAGFIGSADGTGSNARFNMPNSVAVDGAGNVYVNDNFNAEIRKIAPGGAVSTLAGLTQVYGSADGIGSAARFNRMGQMVLDGAGFLYVTDSSYGTIRKIDTGTGAVSTFVGTAGQKFQLDGLGAAAGFVTPAGLTRNAATGDLYITDSSTSTVRKITAAGVVTTIAGVANVTGGTDGVGTAARFKSPAAIAIDGSGNLYVADTGNNTIRRIALDATVSTLAGTAGVSGSADGTGAAARFSGPSGIAVDGAGNLYVADGNNSTIRFITPAGVVTTVAGQAPPLVFDGTGTGAHFNGSVDVALDGAGNAYVADSVNNTIRKITPAGVTTTLAGQTGVSGSANGVGVAAQFNGPLGIAVDAAGVVYVADTANHAIRKIATGGTVTTVAGLPGSSGDIPTGGNSSTAANARFNNPRAIAVDGQGNIFVADANQVIRRIGTDGTVINWAGTAGSSGFVDAPAGQALTARFSNPWKIALDSSGNIWVADRSNASLREVTADGAVKTIASTGSLILGVAADGADNVYFSSYGSVWKYHPATGGLDIVGGGAASGALASSDGVGSAALWYETDGLAANAAGRIYVSDAVGNTIRTGVSVPALTFPAIADRPYGSMPFVPGATTSSGLDVSYKVLSGPAILQGNAVTLTGTGSVTVRAMQEGNDTVQLDQTFSIGAYAAAPAIVGTWSKGDTTTDGSGVLVFLPNGYYYQIQDANATQAAAGGADGFEIGTYTWNPATGAFSVSTLMDTNGNLGLSGLNGVSGITASVSAGSLTFNVPSQSPDTLMGVTGSSRLVGSWIFGDPGVVDHRVIVTFLPNGTYFVAQDGDSSPAGDPTGQDGIERGTYNWNSATAVLTTTAVVDTNGQWGLSNPGAGVPTAIVSGDGVTLHVANASDGSNNYLTRVGPVFISTVTIGQQPSACMVTAGNGLTLAVAASGTGTITYQWRVNGSNLADGLGVSGSTTSTLHLASVQSTTAGLYDVVIIDSAAPGNPTTSAAATVTVTGSPVQSVLTPYVVTTLAGRANIGSADGIGSAARFNSPYGIARDSGGNFYIADYANFTIRKMTPAGVVTTIAGLANVSGSADGAGADARFWLPTSLAFDSAGNLFVADSGNNTIRKIDSAGAVTTFVGQPGVAGHADGPGAIATFSSPLGLAIDASDNVYVADSVNDTIRRITPGGVVSTLAGQPGVVGAVDGTGSAAQFNGPTHLVVSNSTSSLFVSDTFNHNIRQVTFAGAVTTFAGDAAANGTLDGTGPAAHFATPRGIALDSAGNLYVSDVGSQVIRMITPAAVVTTLAGSPGVSGYVDGTGSAARFNSPRGLVCDASNNIFVAEWSNSVIREVSPAGVVTTVAGLGSQAGATDATGSAATFNQPSGVVFDAAGDIFVADAANHTIRMVTPAGVVTTVAGLAGTAGYVDATGSAARFNRPTGIAIDSSGNLYVSESFGRRIRKVMSGGVVTTVAGSGSSGGADGTGTAASFNTPVAIARDATSGNLYVVDSGNHTLRQIAPGGVVTTLAGLAGTLGYADGTGSAARFAGPTGVATDSAGNIYVADKNNHVVRKVTSGGVVTTIAGTAGSAGYVDAVGNAARFNNPYSVAVDSSGNIYVNEYNGGHVRRITSAGVVTTLAGSYYSFGGYADGAGSAALFSLATGIAVTASGSEIAVADTNNNAIRIGVPSDASLPTITAQPVATSAGQGGTAMFTVTASAPGSFVYQWFKDGSAVSGATNASLLISNVQTTNAGIYTVLVSNSAGSVSSTGAALAVSSTITFLDLPTSRRTVAGGKVLFRVSATTSVGGATLTYQWQKNGAPISGATSSDYTIASVTAGDAGSYSVVVSDGTGTAASAGAALTVLTPDNVLWQQFTEFSTEQALQRTINDGNGHVYVPWGIYDRNADVVAGKVMGALVRLNVSDGTIDPTFRLDPRFRRASHVAFQSDGKLIIAVTAGDADTVIRTDTTGAVDPSFTAPLFARGIRFVAVQPDDRVLLSAADPANVDAPASAIGGDAPAVYRLTSSGPLDSGFTRAVLGANAGGTVQIFGPPTLDSSNRIYLAGIFASINGTARINIARLGTDGTLDTAYANPATMPAGFASNQARAVVFQSNGQAVFVGDFRDNARGTANNSNRIMAIRLNTDGTFDGSYHMPLRSELGYNTSIGVRMRYAIALPNDQLLGVSDRLTRLNADGTVDGTFVTRAFGIESFWISQDASGRFYVPEQLSVAGKALTLELWGNGIARFAADGTPDESFQTGGWGRSAVTTSGTVLSDGRVWVGGDFNRFGSVTVPGLAQFAAAGGLTGTQAASGFSMPTGAVVAAGSDQVFAVVTPDFDSIEPTAPAVVRLNADATLDGTFAPVLPANYALGSAIPTAASSGRVVLAQPFVDPQSILNSVTGDSLLRLNANGSRDGTFNPPLSSLAAVDRDGTNNILQIRTGGINVTQILPDDRMLVVSAGLDGSLNLNRLTSTGAVDGGFTAPSFGTVAPQQGNTNNITDPMFPANPATQYNLTIYDPTDLVRAALQMPDGRVYVGGRFALAGSPRGLVRLNTNGTPDATFTGAGIAYSKADSGPYVSSLAVDGAGRLYVAGRFDSFNGTAVAGLFRLNVDGSLDAGWAPGFAVRDAPAAAVRLSVVGTKLYAFGTVAGAADVFAGPYRATDIPPPPSITTAPVSANVTVGGSATFTVAAGGTGPFTYQWFKNGVLISGATSATYSINPVGSTDAANYTVAITGPTGTTLSAPVPLVVSVPVSITVQPQSQALSSGDSFTLTVGVSGTLPFTYQWSKDGTPITGATNASYTVAVATSAGTGSAGFGSTGDAGSYTVFVTNAVGNATSTPAAVVTILPAGFSATHAVVGAGYVAGSTVTITNTINYTGDITALGWSVLLPTGWTYASSSGSFGVSPNAGDLTGVLGWAWTTTPASPVTFTYTLNVPAGETASRSLAAIATVADLNSDQLRMLAKPDPLVVGPVVYHTADTNHDFAIDLNELIRVISIYNTRFTAPGGKVQTGCYMVQSGTPDGFAPDPSKSTPAAAGQAGLAAYHSADTNHDGAIDLNELIRVISLYNTRFTAPGGKIQTGFYKVQAGTPDGYAPDPTRSP